MRRHSTSAITLTLSTLALCIPRAATAQTVTIFQSGFEPGQGYALGNLAGQNGWSPMVPADPSFGKVVNTGALAGSQSVLLDGADTRPGNYGAVIRSAVIAPSLAGKPLRYVETTGLCRILEPTIIAGEDSVFYVYFWSNSTPHAHSGPGFVNGQHRFGHGIISSVGIPVQPNTTFQFRHLLDYQTGRSRAWMNGQLAFQTQFNDSLYLTSVRLDCSSDHDQFDTRAWYDDLHIKAVYGCGGDTNLDLAVNIEDLLAVLNAWGSCPNCPSTPCPADVSPPPAGGASAGNCQVNIDDLLNVLNHWGPCQ